jgi:endonuclease/exonuclease/phosphatase family metal-dependent hydrolase
MTAARRKHYTSSVNTLLSWIASFVLLLCVSVPVFCQNAGRTLKVLTYNIHHANPPSRPNVIDIEAVARVISQSGADLVALQEIDVHTRRSGTGLDEAAELGKLTGMHSYFAKSRDYDGGDYGLAILSKFPILHAEDLPLPLEGGEHRALAVITIEPTPGHTVLFADTHLDLKANNRVLQVQYIKDYFSKTQGPTILCGDFNSTPNSETIRSLDQMFQRSRIASGLTFPMDKPDREIDFVMVRPAQAFSFEEHRVIPERYASDHLPVLVTLGY